MSDQESDNLHEKTEFASCPHCRLPTYARWGSAVDIQAHFRETDSGKRVGHAWGMFCESPGCGKPIVAFRPDGEEASSQLYPIDAHDVFIRVFVEVFIKIKRDELGEDPDEKTLKSWMEEGVRRAKVFLSALTESTHQALVAKAVDLLPEGMERVQAAITAAGSL